MKLLRWFALVFSLLFILFEVPSFAQSLTTLSGVVSDTDSQVWSYATITATLQLTQPGVAVYAAGGSVPIMQTYQLDASGVIAGTIPNNSSIIPPGSRWLFTVCSLTSAPCQTLPAVSITGSTYNLGSYISAHVSAPRIYAGAITYAYNTTEILGQKQGNGYINTTTNQAYLWNGSWVTYSGSGGSASPGSPVGAVQVNANGVFAGTSKLIADISTGNVTSGGTLTSKRNWTNALSTAECATLQFCNQLTDTYDSRVNANGNETDAQTYSQHIIYGAGRAMGPTGPIGGWTTSKVDYMLDEDWTRGIGQAFGGTFVTHSISDKAYIYGYLFHDAGPGVTRNDEGTALLVLEGNENGTDAQTTIAGGTAINPVLSSNVSMTDGGFFLNITKGNADNFKGNLNGNTSGTIAGVYDIPITSTGAAIPASTGIATISADLPDPSKTDAVETASGNITVSVVRGSFSPGQACIAGPVGQFNVPEQVVITAASGSTVNLNYRHFHYAGAGLFQGGLCQHGLSFDDDLSKVGRRSNYIVVGSSTGSDLLYAVNVYGKTDITLPRVAETPETNTSAFHLYPMAEVVAINGRGTNPQLEPNIDFAHVGDTIESDAPFFQEIEGALISESAYTPCTQSQRCNLFELDYGGAVANIAFKPFRLFNTNAPSTYTVGGGWNTLPNFQMQLQGPTNNTFQIDTPYSAVTSVQTAPNQNKVISYGVLFDNAGGSVTSYKQNQTAATTGTLLPGETQYTIGTLDFVAPCMEANNTNGTIITTTCQIQAQSTDGAGNPSLTVLAPKNGTGVALHNAGKAQTDGAASFGSTVTATGVINANGGVKLSALSCVLGTDSGGNVGCNGNTITGTNFAGNTFSALNGSTTIGTIGNNLGTFQINSTNGNTLAINSQGQLRLVANSATGFGGGGIRFDTYLAGSNGGGMIIRSNSDNGNTGSILSLQVSDFTTNTFQTILQANGVTASGSHAGISLAPNGGTVTLGGDLATLHDTLASGATCGTHAANAIWADDAYIYHCNAAGTAAGRAALTSF